jgi:hypothetical protein
MASFAPAGPPTPQGAGRTLATMFVAVAVLAVTGGVFGYLIGAKANASRGAAAPQTHTVTTGGTTPGPTAPASTASPPSGPACPAFIQRVAQNKGATGTLRQELYIRTAKSELWVCAEDGGPTWCQGHVVTNGAYYPQDTPVEGRSGLLLKPVTRLGDGRYQCGYTDATGTWKFTISPTEFVTEHVGADGKAAPPAVEPVTQHTP